MIAMDITCKFPQSGDYILYVQNNFFSGHLFLGRVVKRTIDDWIYIKTSIDGRPIKLRDFDFVIVSEEFVKTTFGEEKIKKLEC